MGINIFIGEGNLTRDVETRYTASGAGVGTFGIAINKKNKDKETVTFIDVTTWGKLAEICSEYLKKGSRILIQGELTFSQWETSEGQKRNKLEVTAHKVDFLDSKQEKDDISF